MGPSTGFASIISENSKSPRMIRNWVNLRGPETTCFDKQDNNSCFRCLYLCEVDFE